MLPGVWDYEHPRTSEVVRNVEGLCRSVLDRAVGKLPRRLEAADYDESLAYLLAEVILLADKYDPARSSGLGDYLSARLGFRLIDFWRRFYGASGQKRVVDPAIGEQARRDAGVDAYRGGTASETPDDRLEARVEELVIGRADLSRVRRSQHGAVREARPAPASP